MSSQVEVRQDAVGFASRTESSQVDNGVSVTKSRGSVVCSNCGRTGMRRKSAGR